MPWLEQKLKDWGVLPLSPEEQKQQDIQALAQKAEQEMQPIREEKQAKEKAQDDLKFVIDGAKLECKMCTVPQGTLKVQLDTPATQDKPTATVAEKDSMSLVFKGNCKKSFNSSSPCKTVMQLEEWQNIGNAKVQDHEPLLFKSTIKCAYGGVPITITDCGQRHKPQEIDITGAPLPIDEEPDPVKYVVTFERLSNYDGEFGFDWMRKAYLPKQEGGQGLCVEGIDKLKQLYEPFQMDIKNREGEPYGDYYSPWVSLFPDHQKKIGKPVKLIMKADPNFIDEDIPFDETMRFEVSDPNLEVGVVRLVYVPATDSGKEILEPTVPFSELKNGKGVTIQINCNGKLAEDATIDVLSSEGFTVGRLNVIKNDTTYRLNVRFVEVKFKGKLTFDNNEIGTKNTLDFSSKKSIAELPSAIISNSQPLSLSDTIDNWKKYVEDNEKDFIKKFGQALIKYEPFKKKSQIDYKKLTVDFKKFTAGTNLEGITGLDRLKNSITSIDIDAIACDMEEFLSGLRELYLEENTNETGVTIFLLPIIIRYSNPHEGVKVDYLDGFADDIFSTGRYILMTKFSSKLRKETLVHEAAHTLGLFHSFQNKTVDHGRDVTPTYSFEFGKTENIMDYNDDVLTFWKWQWNKMHQDTTDLELIP